MQALSLSLSPVHKAVQPSHRLACSLDRARVESFFFFYFTTVKKRFAGCNHIYQRSISMISFFVYVGREGGRETCAFRDLCLDVSHRPGRRQ